MQKPDHTHLKDTIIDCTFSGGSFMEAREEFRRNAAVTVKEAVGNFDLRMWQIQTKVEAAVQIAIRNASNNMPNRMDLLPVRTGRSLVWL